MLSEAVADIRAAGRIHDHHLIDRVAATATTLRPTLATLTDDLRALATGRRGGGGAVTGMALLLDKDYHHNCNDIHYHNNIHYHSTTTTTTFPPPSPSPPPPPAVAGAAATVAAAAAATIAVDTADRSTDLALVRLVDACHTRTGAFDSRPRSYLTGPY